MRKAEVLAIYWKIVIGGSLPYMYDKLPALFLNFKIKFEKKKFHVDLLIKMFSEYIQKKIPSINKCHRKSL